jgi:type III pantothenate kinase
MSISLLLAIDVGNSRTKFGLFYIADLADKSQLPECRDAVAVAHGSSVPWQTLREWGRQGEQWAAIVAGTNPPAIARLCGEWQAAPWPVPVAVEAGRQLPIRIDVDVPEKVGLDRLLNAVAANHIRPEQTPVVIVDTGTAVTVDYVSAAGEFGGGAILPGVDLSALALHQYTALLPRIPAVELMGDVPDPVGRNTRDAIRSGLFWGHVGAIQELVERIGERSLEPPMVLLTGGAAALLAPCLRVEARWEAHLPLKGLAVASQNVLG